MSADQAQLGFAFDDGVMKVPEVAPGASAPAVRQDDDLKALGALESFRQSVREHRDNGAFNRICDDLRMVPFNGDRAFLQIIRPHDDRDDFRLRPIRVPEADLTNRQRKQGVIVHHDTRVFDALRDMGVRGLGQLNGFGYLVNGLARTAPCLSPVRVYSVCVTNLPDARRRSVRRVIRAEDCRNTRMFTGRVNSRAGDVVVVELELLRELYLLDHDRGLRSVVDAPTLALVEEVLGRYSSQVLF